MRHRPAFMRLFVVAVVLLGMVLPSAQVAASSTSTVVKLWVGNNIMAIAGVRQPIDAEGTKPVIVEGRTLVPIRAVIEAFDGTVAWEASTRKVTVSLGENSLDLWIGKSTASLNGTSLPVDAANPRVIPLIMSGRTMLPLRFVSESLGIDVQYEATTKMITLTYAVETTPSPLSAPMLVSPADGSKFMNELPKLSWLPATGGDASRVQILSSGTEVHVEDVTSAEYLIPTGLLTDGTYTWRVSVHNEGGWGSWSGARNFTYSHVALPVAPLLLTPANQSTLDAGSIVLTWASVSNADSYRIRVLRDSAEVHAATTLSGTAYSVPSGVLGAGSYSWSAAAHNSGGWGAWSDPFLFQASAKLTTSDIAKFVDRTVLIEVSGFDNDGAFSASGSGFFIGTDGRIVTNYHVVDAATKGTVTVNGGQKYDISAVLGYSKDQDLAVIRINGTGFPVCTLGDSSKVAVGDPIVAIGSPLGVQNTVSEGIISKIWEDGDLQITAAISPGSSGGALFNMYGEVVGVTTWKIRDGENMNGAVPANFIRGMDTTANLSLTQLYQREHGSVPAVPAAPILSNPFSGASVDMIDASLSWYTSAGADSYNVWIGTGTDPSTGMKVTSDVVTGLSYDLYDADLSPDSTYCWRVAAHNGYGWGEWSEARVFKIPPKLPSPTLYSPTDESTVSVTPTLSWSSVNNALVYEVLVGTGRELSISSVVWSNMEVSGTSVTIPSGKLVPGGTYWWFVACDGDPSLVSDSGPGEVRHFSTAVPLQAPAIISPVNNAVLSTLTPTLSWTTVPGATKYGVRVWVAPSGPPYVIDSETAATNYTVPAGMLSSGTRYAWAVCAGNNSGWSAWSTVLISGTAYAPAFTVQAPVLVAPVPMSPADGDLFDDTDGSVTFTWAPVASASHYEISIALGTSWPGTKNVYNSTVYGTSHSVPMYLGLISGFRYTWTVRAIGASGGSGPWSSGVTFSVFEYGEPTLYSPSNYGTMYYTNSPFMWSSVPLATSYKIFIYEGADITPGGSIISQAVSGTSYVAPGFTFKKGTAYCWWVAAYNGAYVIAMSATGYFYTIP